MAETWVINETPSIRTEIVTVNINFVSNNISYTSIYFTVEPLPPMAYDNIMFGGIDVGIIGVYGAFGAGWRDQAYRTVTFETAPTGDLLTWLQANAVKQASNITLDLSTIGLSVGTHSIQMKLSDDGVTRADSALSNAVSYVVPDPTPQLSTPANITASGTTISFDEVENAEKYEVFADGTSIGEYEMPSGYKLTIAQTYAFGGDRPIKVEYSNGAIEEVSYDVVYNPFEIENVKKILKIHTDSCGYSRLDQTLTGSDPDLVSYIVGLNNNVGWQYDYCPANFEFVLTKDIVYSYQDGTCLAANTLVLTDGGYKEIKDINVDALLLTYNEETKQNEYKKVVKWWHHPSSDLVTINDDLFTMTGDHPIYVNDYEVVKGREVKVGDYLIDKDGNKELVEKVEFSNDPIEVYMIEVEDNHNFYITDKNLLSHNY